MKGSGAVVVVAAASGGHDASSTIAPCDCGGRGTVCASSVVQGNAVARLTGGTVVVVVVVVGGGGAIGASGKAIGPVRLTLRQTYGEGKDRGRSGEGQGKVRVVLGKRKLG